MELSGQEEGDIAIPINSITTGTYGGGHHGNGHGHGHGHLNIHRHHDHDDNSPSPHHSHMMNIASSAAAQLNDPCSNGQDHHHHHQGGYKKEKEKVRYRECLKNHAAAMGGNATDGCGEFMPSGEEGSIEALNCSACHCHRNFHRREVEGDQHQLLPTTCFEYPSSSHFSSRRRKFLPGGHPHHHKANMLAAAATPDEPHLGYPTGAAAGSILPSRAVAPHHHHYHHQMIMPYSIGPLPSESDDPEEGGGMGSRAAGGQVVKKRFRTKFTQEQKEKMLAFADKVGWKIQKQEESVVQQFCQEVGVKRRVLKVWMHNNKHNLAAAAAKKNKNIVMNNHHNTSINNNHPPTVSST